MKLLSLKTPLVYGILLSISFLVFVLYIISAARFITDHDENTCDMTYMFEYPQYVRIGLDDRNGNAPEDYLFPRFRLYAYGEGFVTERLRRMHFSGIPVLFVPGNAGSHEQVRSIASVSLRMSLKKRTPFHFDYFSISFGKDYSALYGGVLKEETEYVAKCIKKILSLYQGKAKSFILIGHSMGGLIAKGALLLIPEVNSDITSILITLATPHKPSFYPDLTFLNYYQKLTNSMQQLRKNGTTVVSIGGGSKDILVPASQAFDEFADLNVITTSIPGVWRSTDHLCILWCKQLVLKIVRSLFDCVDTSKLPSLIYQSQERRLKAFNWHFVQRYSMGKYLLQTDYMQKVKFSNEEDDEWIEDIRRQYTWSSKNFAKSQLKKSTIVYLMIRVNIPVDTLSVDAINLKRRDWIFACTASEIQRQSRVCLWGYNLSNQTKITPGSNRKPWKHSIDLDLNEIRALGVSHVVIRVPARKISRYSVENYKEQDDDNDDEDDDDDDDQIIHVDSYTRSMRYKRINSVKSFVTEERNLRFFIILEGITDAASAEVKHLNCVDNGRSHYAIAELREPWAPGAEQTYVYLENGESKNILKLQTIHSQRVPLMKSENAELKLYLDPECTYRINVQRADLIERMSCLVRDRWMFLYQISVGLLLLSIGQRIDSQNEDDNTSFSAIFIITTVLCFILNLVVECFVSIAILHLMAVGICCLVVFFGSVVHNVAVRFLARAVTFSTTWSDWLLGGLVNQLPVMGAGVLLSIIPATCGALAMILSIFLHFLRLTRMYEDCLEELFLASMRHFNLLKKRDNKNEELSDAIRECILNQILLFLLWCFAAIPAVPTVLVWAKNFSFSTRLVTEDQVFLYSWIIMVGCGTSGLVQIPKSKNFYKTKLLAALLRCLGWIALAVSATSNSDHYYWCFSPFIALSVLLISINSLQV